MAGKEVVQAAIGALEGTSNTIDFWLLIFTCVVALGVIGEAVFGVAHLLNANKLAPLRAREAQLTTLEVSSANARALEAQAELARFKAPRDLSQEQRASITERMKPFSGTVFQLNTYPGDNESVHFANQIEEILTSAGWKRVNVMGTPLGLVSGVFANVNEISGFDANGIAIRVPSPAEVRAASALVDALRNEGVGANMAAPASEMTNPRVAVKITVGRKP